MTSSDVSRPRRSRRFLWLAIFIVILFGGYSAGWFYVAGELQGRARAAIADFNGSGRAIDCGEPTVRGFPFRIGLFCDNVGYDDPAEQVSLSAGALRSAAQVYDPFLIVAELDSPARLVLPGVGTVGANWSNLRSSIRYNTSAPERISVEVRKLAGQVDAAGGGADTFTVEAGEAHMQAAGDDLDLAVRFSDAGIPERILRGGRLPPFDGEGDVTIKDGMKVAFDGRSLRGRSGTIHKLSLSTGTDAGLTVSGTFAVDEAGLLDADLTLSLRKPADVAKVLENLFPAMRDQITASMAGLAALGETPRVPLKIVDGQASIGFLPLGRIRPL